MRSRSGRLAAVSTLAMVAAVGLSGCGEAPITTVTLTVHYSTFEPSRIEVPHGVPVTFVLVNDDPIDHEWIIGDAASHEAHRTGTEPAHDARPTEVTVPALETRVTTVTFPEPGELAFICHLPGHEAYGMVGVLIVT
jgi:uncharacterized cupredoxin-like copper-binding protein